MPLVIQLGGAPMDSKADVIDAFVALLSGIDGATSGYHHDLESRVFTKDEIPQDGGKMPFLTVLHAASVSNYEDNNTKEHYQRGFDLLVTGFVNEKTTSRMSTSISEIANLEDDIVRAILSDETLDGKVRAMTMVQSQTFGPQPKINVTYAEVQMIVRFLQIVDHDDLGSS